MTDEQDLLRRIANQLEYDGRKRDKRREGWAKAIAALLAVVVLGLVLKHFNP